MEIRAAEISAILKEEIKNFGSEAEVAEVARIFGERRVDAGEPVTDGQDRGSGAAGDADGSSTA